MHSAWDISFPNWSPYFLLVNRTLSLQAIFSYNNDHATHFNKLVLGNLINLLYNILNMGLYYIENSIVFSIISYYAMLNINVWKMPVHLLCILMQLSILFVFLFGSYLKGSKLLLSIKSFYCKKDTIRL